MTYDVATLSAARLWEYQPDFAQGFEIRRAFRTDIKRSRNNTEQRRALRDVPRLSTSYSTKLSGADLQAAKLFLRTWQNKPVAMPDFGRWFQTTGASSSGTNSLTIGSPPAWVATGQLALLCSSTVSELVEITNVAGSTVTLADNLTNSWASGSVIRPVLHGLLDAALQAARLTRGDQAISVKLACYPGGEPPEDEGTASDTFNGYEVFTTEPDFAGAPGMDYLWPVENVDFGIGRTAQFRPIEQHEQLIECSFAGLSPSEAEAIEQFWLRQKGRRGAFYRPTCEKDMTLAADASASITIDVEGTDLATYFPSFDSPYTDTAIEIVLQDGSRLRRTITSAAVNGSNSRLTLSASTTAAVADVARISWMPLVRFANDELATRWRSPLKASISASFQSLRLPS